MIFQNKDGLWFSLKKKEGCCHPSIQNVLLPAALISLVTAGQREEIELEIVETLLLFHFLAFVFFSSPPAVFSEVSTETNGKSSYCQDS